jgi:hypothetical protein
MQRHPELFAHPAWQATSVTGSPGVETPLGEVSILGAVDGHELRLDAASVFIAESGAQVWVWDGGVFRAELLRCRPRAALPEGMSVGGWEAAMWRLSAAERPAECEVACRWVELPGEEPGSPESGENLEAQSWSDGRSRVLIGTPDLGGRVRYLRDGFTVRAPLERAEALETHFVLAWSLDRPGDESPWFAVDCTSQQVLAGINSLGA